VTIRHLAVEVDRPNRQARWRSGKSDPLDAVEAARAALSGDRLDPPGRRLLFLRANVTVRRGGRAALTAITTRAVGHQLAVIVAGIAWNIDHFRQPLTEGTFETLLPGRKQAPILMHTLIRSG